MNSDDCATAMLRLGRLDGRLINSPVTDIFLAKSRLSGAARLATLAGVPVAVADLQRWISGQAGPPRASEGLNDPISVAAVFHVAVARDEDSRDPVLRASLNVLRRVLDDRAEAQVWAGEDLAHFGPLWRRVRTMVDRPYGGGGLRAVAERIFEIAEHVRADGHGGAEVVAADGRVFTLPPSSRDHNWLLATAVPRMLHRAGLTTRVVPSLVLLPRYLPASPALLVPLMTATLAALVHSSLSDLDALEQSAQRRLAGLHATRRSRAPLLARLDLAYPGLQPRAVAHLLGVTPQGARKLLAGLSARLAAMPALRDA